MGQFGHSCSTQTCRLAAVVTYTEDDSIEEEALQQLSPDFGVPTARGKVAL